MSKTEYYRQCEMRKPLENGYTSHIAWIPEKYAVKEKIIKIKFDDGWIDGWEVYYVGNKKEYTEVNIGSQAYKHQRNKSDI